MHLCWGNYEGPHHCDVPLADIIDIVFRARPSAISLEAANPRHGHEWALFETVKLPEGKVLIPGVIESKTNFIEHPDLVAQRIGRYAKLVGRENVIAGSDCGYGTWVGQAAVDPDIVWAKLAIDGRRRADRVARVLEDRQLEALGQATGSQKGCAGQSRSGRPFPAGAGRTCAHQPCAQIERHAIWSAIGIPAAAKAFSNAAQVARTAASCASVGAPAYA